jgi:ubiquinone/menaquinone biosynthesis C-methylase UbiE
MGRGYQEDFSSLYSDALHSKVSKQRKANTMVKILSDHHGERSLSDMSLLDVGASTGYIDYHLSKVFRVVTGIDIDHSAIAYAKANFRDKNLHYSVGDAMSLELSNSTVDVVICSQVYEHVPDASKMMAEIYRVLKPGGVCYFAATNRLSIEEHHYHLPFLSVIPRPLGHVYLRLAGKGRYYYEKHLSYWGLKKIVNTFEVIDYSRRVINDPLKYAADYMLKPGSKKQLFAKIIVDWFYWLCPGYIWLLRKPE